MASPPFEKAFRNTSRPLLATNSTKVRIDVDCPSDLRIAHSVFEGLADFYFDIDSI